MGKALDRATDILGLVAGALFVLLFLANVFNITARYVFAVSYIWIPDLSRILFIWMIFLGATAAYMKGQHLIIDVLRERFQRRHSRVSDWAIRLTMAAFLTLLIVKGARITSARMNIPYDAWDAVPTAVAYAAVPVAATIMLLATALRLVADLKASRDTEEADASEESGAEGS
ncbi:MAG: TRAP transporter small permease [Alphaproteobacteria bacterium]